MFLFSPLKLRPAVVAVAALLLFPLSAPPALAWESACAEFQFPKVWFDGKFQVLYGFERMPPEEGPHYNGRRWETKPVRESQYHRLAGWGATSGYRVTPGEVARGATGWSGTMRTGNKRCVSLADVRPGEKFVFYMVPGVGAGARDQDGIFLRDAFQQSRPVLSSTRPSLPQKSGGASGEQSTTRAASFIKRRINKHSSRRSGDGTGDSAAPAAGRGG